MKGQFEIDCLETELLDLGENSSVEPVIRINDLNHSQVKIEFPSREAFDRFKKEINSGDN